MWTGKPVSASRAANGRTAGPVRASRTAPFSRAESALIGPLRDPDQRRPQQPVLHHIAGLHLLDDRARFLVARNFHHRLVAVRVERLTLGVDAGDPVPLEHGVELA